MPAWTLEELKEYNELLTDDMKLQKADLEARYYEFGGIARSVFSKTQHKEHMALQSAIESFDALKAKDDSLEQLSAFAVAHSFDNSRSTAPLRGKIYELLAHKWLTSLPENELKLRGLGSKAGNRALKVERMTRIDFSKLSEIHVVPQQLTYFRPKPKLFGASDALIVDGFNHKCYGLQMTINSDHGIHHAPLRKLLNRLEEIGFSQDSVYFFFVVPKHLEPDFKQQSIVTKDEEAHQKPGRLVEMRNTLSAWMYS